MKLSNKFTLMRVCFAPVFFLIYSIPIWTGSVLLQQISAYCMIPLLIIFELTDFFDGYYARKRGEVGDFGKLFDPFADVMLNLTVFLCAMSSVNRIFGGYMPSLIFVLILYRELSMNFLRMIASKQGVAIAARKGGKLKTVSYIVSGFFALAVESALRLGYGLGGYGSELHTAAVVLFSLCLVLSYLSFIDYLRIFASILKKDL
ncbi:MAG: CDP-diacylglycerol--glycerol-3-phosphate 3-phosphatidyltransferase [Treponema sp.]|nr:CDP-diacylglycerol--glycerol-3-phosphate 3-phosphatidyltransferase [Treponema sp.]MBD5448478.1 CDP-diacylglycerol--glycerol-3-phosphate 3-phosphatidyltransferase [Treponema sp.]